MSDSERAKIPSWLASAGIVLLIAGSIGVLFWFGAMRFVTKAESQARNMQGMARVASEMASPPTRVRIQRSVVPESTLDPDLQRAWAYYKDNENCRREEALKLFESYLESHPDTPFRAEILYRMGTLYSTRINRNLGEKRDRHKAREYFEKAHAIYGKKWTFLNMSAWSALVDDYEVPLEDRMEYFDWLVAVTSNPTEDDLYPIAEMGHSVQGVPVQFPPERMATAIQSVREHADMFVDTATRNILHFTRDRDDLVKLALKYKERALGQGAQKKIDEMDKAASSEFE